MNIFKPSTVNPSTEKMEQWLANRKLDLLFAALEKGTYNTRMEAVKVLAKLNVSQVKEAILEALNDPVKGVALTAADRLIYMGVTPAERKKVEQCKQKWSKTH